jgi:hypothetical protein
MNIAATENECPVNASTVMAYLAEDRSSVEGNSTWIYIRPDRVLY